MASKQTSAAWAAQDAAKGWVRHREWVSPGGRRVEVGTEVSVRGERGRFRFREHVVTPTGEWLYLIGGPGKGENQTRQARFFTPDRVKTVHLKVSGFTGSEAQARMLARKRERRAAVQ